MGKIFDKIGKRVEGSNLYLAPDGNGKEIKDTFYFGVKLAKGKSVHDFLECFEPIHSKLESKKDLDVHAPVSLIKPSEYAFYNMPLEDAYQNGETIFKPEDDVYNVIIDGTGDFASFDESYTCDLVDVTFREQDNIVLGEITYENRKLISLDEYKEYFKDEIIAPGSVSEQDVWNNVVKKLANKMEENGLLDNTVNEPVMFTDDMILAMNWNNVMYNKKNNVVEIGKIALDFNNDECMYGVQCILETPEGKEVYKTFSGELDDFEHKDENRDYNVFENNEIRRLLGLSSNSMYNIPEEVESIRFTEDCQLKVSFTNLFGDNPDVNSVTFPLKDIASKEITNDLLAKKFPEVFSDDLRMVVEYVNTESASYLKPVVERYNLDNPKKKIKEITNLAPDDKVKGQTNKLGK